MDCLASEQGTGERQQRERADGLKRESRYCERSYCVKDDQQRQFGFKEVLLTDCDNVQFKQIRSIELLGLMFVEFTRSWSVEYCKIILKILIFACLSETKANSFSCESLVDFDISCAPRKDENVHFGGTLGLAILVKFKISTWCNLIESVCNNVLWMLVDAKVIGFEFILGAVYIPHEGVCSL